MNANSMPQTPAIKDWLDQASNLLLDANIPSFNLDAEILLANVLNQDRTFLHAHPERLITPNQLKIADHNLKLRAKRLPIAYIIGNKEFYGRKFKVSPDTLIPRPESETIIELLTDILKSNPKKQPIKLVDIGTGSGCLGITAKLEFPNIEAVLIDISNDALKIAAQNAKDLSADVQIIQSNLLQDYSPKADIILANLPYVDPSWERSPETDYEPGLALFADDDGLSIIKTLITQTDDNLAQNGYLLIEADPIQHNPLIEFAQQHSLTPVQKIGYVIVFRKIQ